MKKYLIIMLMAVCLYGYGETPKIGSYWKVDSLSRAIGKTFTDPAKYPLIFCYETKSFYQAVDTILSTRTLTQAIAAGEVVNITPFVASPTTITTTIAKLTAAYITGTHSNITSDSTTNLVVSGVPVFSIACGTLTVNSYSAKDTVGVAISGLTSGGLAICSYAGYVASPDTLPYAYQYKAGWLTVCGKRGVPINYWIPKK